MNEDETKAEMAPASIKNSWQGVGGAAVSMAVIILIGYTVLSMAPKWSANPAPVLGPVRPAQSYISAPTAPTSPNIEIGGPLLVADKEKVDLGDVNLGKVVKVDFQLTNEGHQPLRISKAPYIEVLEGC
ncbi:MAG TPA: hypothetical protein VGK87_06830 [Anaerolineae bacterium]|jgi:hypothetical protein